MSQLPREGVLLTPGAAARLQSAIPWVEHFRNSQTAEGEHSRDSFSPRFFPARITEVQTSSGFTLHAWEEVYWSPGQQTFIVKPNGRTSEGVITAPNRGRPGSGNPFFHPAMELNGRTAEPGAVVIIHYGKDASNPSGTIYFFQLGATGTFPVLCNQAGGQPGDDENPCSFTYTVTDLLGNPLGKSDPKVKNDKGVPGAPIGPVWRRPLRGRMSPAEHGWGVFVPSGDFQLWECDEQPEAESCEDEELGLAPPIFPPIGGSP